MRQETYEVWGRVGPRRRERQHYLGSLKENPTLNRVGDVGSSSRRLRDHNGPGGTFIVDGHRLKKRQTSEPSCSYKANRTYRGGFTLTLNFVGGFTILDNDGRLLSLSSLALAFSNESSGS